MVQGCGNTDAPPSTPSVTDSFHSIAANVFVAQGCTSAPSCHNSEQTHGDLNLEPSAAYNQLVGHTTSTSSTTLTPLPRSLRYRVVPFQPDSSFLMCKLTGVGMVHSSKIEDEETMPLNLPPLSQHDIDMIRKWIQEGAKNN